MENVIYLETYSTFENYEKSTSIELPLESFITYCVYKSCLPKDVLLYFVFNNESKDKCNTAVVLSEDNLHFLKHDKIPWQVTSCLYPVVLYRDTIITGLCAVARHISKYRTISQSPKEHEEGILGFRKGCLQAPNEVSIWTKFCEVDIIKTVKNILNTEVLQELPQNLVRLENHLKKPIRVHNVYKMARELKKEDLRITKESEQAKDEKKEILDKNRVPKTRKWKSATRKELEINSSISIEDLNIGHYFAEGPFLTLADLILLPSYHILIQSLGMEIIESLLPLTHKWYFNVTHISELQNLTTLLQKLKTQPLALENVSVPDTEDVSLYKCDPKRHNPKKRLYTKEDDIENALSCLTEGMELDICDNDFQFNIDWNTIPDGANPTAGHLPDVRVKRKSQQLENLALAVLSIAKEGDLIVDFCSGSGHLGILIAHLLPKCTIILLENKEQSLLRARSRVHEMGLKNIYFFQCNLDFFIGKFDIGIALHACGIASDLVLDKCLKANAKFVLCPCCYGSLHATDRLVYPRSSKFCNVSIDQYLCIGHAADQTHDLHPLTIRGAKCMAVIDSDRGRLAEEFGYNVSLSRLKPLTCTPKNNLLIGVPS